MRPLRAFFIVVFVAAGIVLGALNAAPVVVDLGVVALNASLGVALLCTLLLGVLLGGLAIIVSVVRPLRRELSRKTAVQTPSDQTIASTSPES